MTRQARPVITPTIEQARRAIYVDFEGTMVDPPSLLGATWSCDTRDDWTWVQFVIEAALWPAAEAKSIDAGFSCRPATLPVAVSEIREVSVSEGRLVFAWSSHESEEMANVEDPVLAEWARTSVIDALPLARKWKRLFHPSVVFEKDTRRLMRGRHRLECYQQLIGYHVPRPFGAGQSAQHSVRSADAREPER